MTQLLRIALLKILNIGASLDVGIWNLDVPKWSQLAGCGTSVGANYCEANEGVSKKDFLCSIGRCKKEAKETKFFLRMIAASEPLLADEARALYLEANELNLIFASMYRKGR